MGKNEEKKADCGGKTARGVGCRENDSDHSGQAGAAPMSSISS